MGVEMNNVDALRAEVRRCKRRLAARGQLHTSRSHILEQALEEAEALLGLRDEAGALLEFHAKMTALQDREDAAR